MIAHTAELSESLSAAFLVLLETLSPRERAVFLEGDQFGGVIGVDALGGPVATGSRPPARDTGMPGADQTVY